MLVLERRECSARSSAVPAIDPKGTREDVLTLNVSAQAALIGAFDPMLRALQGVRRVVGRYIFSVARKPRAYWGAYTVRPRLLSRRCVGAYGDEMEADQHGSEPRS